MMHENYTNKSTPLSNLSAIVVFYDCPGKASNFQSIQDSSTLPYAHINEIII